MPTRIVLREDAPSAVRSSRELNNAYHNHHGDESVTSPRSTAGRSRIGTPGRGGHYHLRQPSTVRFRSSILRKVNEDEDASVARELGTDIRSSPRLIGYLYTLTSSCVLLVSVSRFFADIDSSDLTQFRALEEEAQGDNPDDFVQAFGSPVLRWKLDSALVVASVGIAMSLSVFLVHIDTVFFPRLWKRIFQDGSRGERNLLLFMLLFWLGAVYICTSSFSVGEVQANVYFTTWISFFSTALNYNIWRMGADLTTFEEKLASFRRETSHNWVVTAAASLIGSFAAVEFYFNRNYVEKQYDQITEDSQWIQGLTLTWGSFFICLVALFGNTYITGSFEMNLCSRLKMTLDWFQFEGVLALGMVGLYGWLVLEYTGVTGLFNGPSNPYFGIWCTFFSSIFTFGTWFREYKNFVLTWGLRSDSQHRNPPPEPSP